MKILITGGCGFIGSNLCKTLLNMNHTIMCVDNLFTGNLKNIEPFINHPNFIFNQHDVKNNFDFDFEPEQIYHLACPASPIHYQPNSLDTLLTCINGTINMLKLAHKTNARILNFSTSEVYGDPNISPQNENYNGNVNINGPRSCYDEGKRISETLCTEYNKIKNVDIRIVRIFNTYGPNLNPNDGRVISNFIMQALKNEDITIYGNGEQTRSFCYVDDLIDGLIKMMNCEKYYGPINLGNPNEMTIYETAKIIINLTNSQSKIIFCDLPIDDPKQRNPDITKAIKYLNWKPTTSFEDGILKTIQYFNQF